MLPKRLPLDFYEMCPLSCQKTFCLLLTAWSVELTIHSQKHITTGIVQEGTFFKVVIKVSVYIYKSNKSSVGSPKTNTVYIIFYVRNWKHYTLH